MKEGVRSIGLSSLRPPQVRILKDRTPAALEAVDDEDPPMTYGLLEATVLRLAAMQDDDAMVNTKE